MTTQIHSRDPALLPMPCEPFDPDRLGPGREPRLEMAGKAVFVTVQGTEAARRIAAKYSQVGAKLAILDVVDWTLQLLPTHGQPGGRADSDPPLRCRSWANAAEEAIALFGPIDLWIDTRPMNWIPVRPAEKAL